MTNIDDFNRKECGKIDSACINAYVDYKITEGRPELCVDTSWGGGCIDLTPIVKLAETVTSLSLTPAEKPNCLRFEREDGGSDCIAGEDLARIIPMTKLKDVNQEIPPKDGDVYIYQDGEWKPFDLGTYIKNNDLTINSLRNTITNLQKQLQEFAQYWEIPEGMPEDAKVMFGNINLYSDCNAQVDSGGSAVRLDKNHGIYGHSLKVDKKQDELFG